MDDALFVSESVRTKTVELPDGSVHTWHFHEMSQAQFEEFKDTRTADDADLRRGAAAKLVSDLLCGEDGVACLSHARACQLKPVALNAMVGAIMEINGLAKKAAPQVLKNGSGMSSVSPSVATP